MATTRAPSAPPASAEYEIRQQESQESFTIPKKYVSESQESYSVPKRCISHQFTFDQLLEELSRAHEREVQVAKGAGAAPGCPRVTELSSAKEGTRLPERFRLSDSNEMQRTNSTTDKSQSLIQNLLHIARGTNKPEIKSSASSSPLGDHEQRTPAVVEPTGQSSSAEDMRPAEGRSPAEGVRQVQSQSVYSKSPVLNIGEKIGEQSSHKKPTSRYTSFMLQVTKFLTSEHFEFSIALAIITNSVIMFCECQYLGLDVGFDLQYPGRSAKAQDTWVGAAAIFVTFDWFFGIVFTLEMIVKLVCFQLKYFLDWDKVEVDEDAELKKGWRNAYAAVQGWNVLDFLCVVAFLFDKVASSSSAFNPQIVRSIRLFRLFRLVRLLRFLETLDHLYVMTTAISGLSKVLGYAIGLLTTMLVTCNIFLVQILQVTYFDVEASGLNEDQLRKHHEMYEYFGTATRCMLTMFELTLGNWPPAARLLSEEVSEWFGLICVLHKLTIGFAVVGVITGIILQETFKVAQTDDMIMLRAKKRANDTVMEKMKRLFNTLDAERDGKLSAEEFSQIAADPEIKIWLSSLDIETDDVQTLFQLIDKDGGGYITLDELVERVPRIKGAARGIDVMSIMNKLSYDLETCKSILQSNDAREDTKEDLEEDPSQHRRQQPGIIDLDFRL